MRNGLNISGLSEYVNELKTKPEEAVIKFSTVAALNRGLAQVETRTGTLGTTRMARGFRIDLEPADAVTEHLTTDEAAVAALGACVLITHVQGFSVRGVNLTALTVDVHADVEVDASGRWVGGDESLRNLGYKINVVGNGPVEQTRAIAQFATCFSPNHRAFLDSAQFRVEATVCRADGNKEEIVLPWEDLVADQPSQAASGRRTVTVEAALRWDYGTETHITTSLQPDPQRRRTPTITADQPKQMSGFDKGSNPQELLLTAVSADLAYGVQRAAAAAEVALSRVEVDCHGQLDIRGMQNVSKEVPARFHELRFHLDIESGAPVEQLRQAVIEAVRTSVPLASLRRANEIDVDVCHDGEPELRFLSNGAQVTEFLRIIDEQAAAQSQALVNEAEAAAAASGAPADAQSEPAEMSVARG